MSLPRPGFPFFLANAVVLLMAVSIVACSGGSEPGDATAVDTLDAQETAAAPDKRPIRRRRQRSSSS